MLIDTDVFVWYLRGNNRAAKRMSGIDQILLSAITYMELVQGMRNQQELLALRKTIKDYAWQILPIDEQTTYRAMIYVEDHFLRHSLRMADALIAATAVQHGLGVLTANDKHYKVIDQLVIEIFRP